MKNNINLKDFINIMKIDGSKIDKNIDCGKLTSRLYLRCDLAEYIKEKEIKLDGKQMKLKFKEVLKLAVYCYYKSLI